MTTLTLCDPFITAGHISYNHVLRTPVLHASLRYEAGRSCMGDLSTRKIGLALSSQEHAAKFFLHLKKREKKRVFCTLCCPIGNSSHGKFGLLFPKVIQLQQSRAILKP